METESCCSSSGESCRTSGRACRILSCGGHALLAVVVFSAVALALGVVVMYCWNFAIPALFNLPMITFWQAVALMVLVRVLTLRLHHHRRYHGHGSCCWGKAKTEEGPGQS